MSMTTELIDRLRQHADTFAKSGFAVDGLVKDYREAADTIEALSAKLHSSQMDRSSQFYNGGWIPVSERLPEENEEVLVTFKSDDEIRVYNCKYFDNSPWWKNYVIAWMPLPEPYKVEGRL